MKTRNRVNYLKRNYGVSIVQYLAQHAHQVGKCAICRKPGKLHADHCHITGKFRGLLCHQCNAALGYLRDNPAVVATAGAYIRSRGVC